MEKDGLSFEVEDYGAATENVMLAITAMGYASVWIDGLMHARELKEEVKKLLQIPDDKTVRCILPIGVPVKEVAQNPKKKFEERVWFNLF